MLAAAQAHGARLVSMENVYMYGRPAGRPLTETREHDAHTHKGRLRSRMSRELLAAHEAGTVEVAIGRASDYYGPRGGAQSNLGDRVVPPALGGHDGIRARRPRPAAHLHVHPRHRRGAGGARRAPRRRRGGSWHLPNDPDTRSTRELVDVVYALAGQPRARVREVPALLLRAVALTNQTVRELLEMGYQFEEPFVVDSSDIRTLLGVQATTTAARPGADRGRLPARS